MFWKYFTLILTILTLTFFVSANYVPETYPSTYISNQCQTMSLTPSQVQAIWNNFLYPAAKSDTIYSGDAVKDPLAADKKAEDKAKTDADKGQEECVEVNDVSVDGKTGVKVGIGCEENPLKKDDIINNEVCYGDYAHAYVLEETLRLARCVSLDKGTCAVELPALNYSSSMEGIKLAWETFKDAVPLLDSDVSSDFTTKEMLPLTVDNTVEDDFLNEGEVLEPKIDSSVFSNITGLLDSNAEVPKRVEGETIPNHIKADNFEAHFEDVCAGQDAPARCKVYAYSYFDRHYNALYSTTIIGSMFAPMVSGIGKKLLPNLKNDLTPSFLSKVRTSTNKRTVEDVMKKLNDEGLISTVGKKNFDELEKLLAGGKTVEAQELLQKEFAKHLKGNVEYQRMFADYVAAKSAYAQSLKAQISGLDDDAILKLMNDETVFSKTGAMDPVKAFSTANPKYGSYGIESAGQVQGITGGASKDFFKAFQNGDDLSTKLYQSTGYTKEASVSGTDLKAYVDSYLKANPNKSLAVQIDGSYVTIVADNAEDILKRLPPGVDVDLFASGFSKMDDAAAATLLTNLKKEYAKSIKDSVDSLAKTNNMIEFLAKNKLIYKSYANTLHYAMFNTFDNRLLNTPVGTLTRWTTAPYLYWQMKTSDTPLKAYFIGEKELTRIKIYTGNSKIYNDAYIDFFVNDTLSNGDFFESLIIKPIQDLAVQISSKESEEKVANFFGVKPRDNVEDVVLYSGTENCSDCISSRQLNAETVFIASSSKLGTKNYILEKPDIKTYNDPVKGGFTLAAFTHHTNIDFYMGDEAQKDVKIKGSYNLETAIQNNETCSQKMETTFFGNIPLLGDYFKESNGRLGLPVGIVDSIMSYLPALYLSSLPALGVGLVMSMGLHEAVRRQFDGCIDSEEGYYIQYNHKFESNNQKTDALSSLVSKGKEQISKADSPMQVTNKANSTMNDIKNNVLKLVESKEKEFSQIKFYTYNNTLSKIEGTGIFMVWMGPRSTCSIIDAEEGTVIGAKINVDGKEVLVTHDTSDGTIRVDGAVVAQSEVLKFRQRNNIFGGFEVPQRITFMPANIGQDYFQFLPNGEFRILNSSTSSCAMQGAYEQTGLSYSNIMEYTGVIKTISAETANGNVTILPNGYSLDYLGGSLERTSFTSGITVDKSINLIDSTNKDLGKFTSVVFDKAHIWYREETKDFAFWVRVMKTIAGEDIQKFTASPTTVINPDTGCEELALDLSVIGNQLDAQAKIDGEEFDKTLKKAGPFQYFETDKKIFMFYSKLEESGECQDYFKVIDKATNQVLLDTPINSVEQIENGIKINTADGSHTLEFSNENGKPVLSFNGEKGTLLLAQGREGSFYFDPSTKTWYVGNSQTMPFNDKFATEGTLSDGTGISKPSTNPLGTSVETYGKKGIFDIPLFVGFEKYLFVILSLFFGLAFIYFRR